MSEAIAHTVDQHVNLLTGAQLRAARAILKWSVSDLAGRTGVASALIRRFEDMDEIPASHSSIVYGLTQVLAGAGVDFVFQPGVPPGVRPAPGLRRART